MLFMMVSVKTSTGNRGCNLVLREDWHDGDACITTNNRHVDEIPVRSIDLSHILCCAGAIESGDSNVFMGLKPFVLQTIL